MRVSNDIPHELKRLINAILTRSGDCESWQNGYNRNPWGYTWFGNRMICEPLFCCYGCIGYIISYNGHQIHVDNDLSRIDII